MTDLRKAAYMALEFLEHVDRFDPNGRYGLDEKIDALIQALAQPEQDHGFDRTASHMAGEYVNTAQHEQSSAMDEWRSMVVVNLLRRCPNLSKHELCELAAHFESRLPVAQTPQKPDAWMHVQGDYAEASIYEMDKHYLMQGWDQYPLYAAPPSKPCAITDLLQQKFQSGNNVPVERVTITRSEYEAALRSKNT